jgi:hypothetical protein
MRLLDDCELASGIYAAKRAGKYGEASLPRLTLLADNRGGRYPDISIRISEHVLHRERRQVVTNGSCKT